MKIGVLSSIKSFWIVCMGARKNSKFLRDQLLEVVSVSDTYHIWRFKTTSTIFGIRVSPTKLSSLKKVILHY